MRALVLRSASEIWGSGADGAGGIGGVEDVMAGAGGGRREPKGRLATSNAQARIRDSGPSIIAKSAQELTDDVIEGTGPLVGAYMPRTRDELEASVRHPGRHRAHLVR